MVRVSKRVVRGRDCAHRVQHDGPDPERRQRGGERLVQKRLSREEVRAAIVHVGAGLGLVEVRNPYRATGCGIVYKSGTKLQESGGEIHRNYNGWIQNLNRGINAQLAAS